MGGTGADAGAEGAVTEERERRGGERKASPNSSLLVDVQYNPSFFLLFIVSRSALQQACLYVPFVSFEMSDELLLFWTERTADGKTLKTDGSSTLPPRLARDKADSHAVRRASVQDRNTRPRVHKSEKPHKTKW